MVTDGQVKELRRLLSQGKTLASAARMSEMSEKTARNYRSDSPLPSQRKTKREYRTRTDPFAEVWPLVERRLTEEPKLKAVTLFGWLQDEYDGQFPDSTRRTFERKVRKWRATEGPGKTVFFSQIHQPGRLAASDFTVCNELGVKIAGVRFDHTLFHCVLTYSNVESVSLCYSESFESLSDGIQKALWEFGGVPDQHRTDSLSAAVRNHTSRKLLTERYVNLMDHYGCEAQRTNARCANENGDVESSNGHLKDRLEQALLLRGSRDFESREQYMVFVEQIVARGNAGRAERFAEDQAALQRLPDAKLDTDDVIQGVRVSKGSTIKVRTNTYSVPSRLIDHKVDIRLSAERIVVTHGGVEVQTMDRLVGKNGKSINYRHIIDSLVRKPGAFARYQHREEMFPTTQFRIAYDMLTQSHTEKEADKKYVAILELAAKESQDAVADALRHLISSGASIEVQTVRDLVADATSLPAPTDVTVEPPNLSDFDFLIPSHDKECQNDGQDHDEACEQNGEANACRTESESHRPADGSAQVIKTADVPGGVRVISDSSGHGEDESPGLSVGTGNLGMRDSPRGSCQTVAQPFQTSVGQNVGIVRLRPVAIASQTSTRDPARRLVFRTPRERSALRQTRQRQEPRLVRAGSATGPSGTQHAVHDMQLTSSAALNREERPSPSAPDQDAFELRWSDHRRPRIRATRPRRDGSVVYASGRTLRTGKRVADEQSGIQQMGPDLQGCDDYGRSNRSPRSSQRDHRTQRPELSSRNSQEDKTENLNRNSNCR